MHFEFLIEDFSGKKVLEILVPKIIDIDVHSYRIIHYKDIGSIPKGLKTAKDASKKALLTQLPRLLAGYGKTYQYNQFENVVIVVCDLDDKLKDSFLEELNDILRKCNPIPQASFCLAIEEIEAWLLGDFNAIKKAYPKAKDSVLNTYKNDSICGTWELMADAIVAGGSKKLKQLGFHETGIHKAEWAEKVCPHMDININKSPSFNDFIETIKKYIFLLNLA